ncbi:MAG: leucine-rich repeat domain-containing protein, partial [Candidatus Hodarchaeota archaeon]
SISLNWFIDQLKRYQSDYWNVFFIIDSSRANMSQTMGSVNSDKSVKGFKIPKEDLPVGISFLFSSSPAQRSHSIELEGREHSIFSYVLLNGLRNVLPRPITFGSLVDYVTEEVPRLGERFGRPLQHPMAICHKRALDIIISGRSHRFLDIIDEQEIIVLETLERLIGRKINQITTVDKDSPHFYAEDSHIKRLNLDSLDLKSLPDIIGNLTYLENLSIRNNRLISLPKKMNQLNNLYELNLSSNEFSTIPECIRQLENLQELNMSANLLHNLPKEFVHFNKLKKLNLERNLFSSLPNIIKQLTGLEELNVANNEITVIPNWIGKLSNLQVLNLSKNQFTSLPSTINLLKSLQDLYLGENKLSEIPSSLK